MIASCWGLVKEFIKTEAVFFIWWALVDSSGILDEFPCCPNAIDRHPTRINAATKTRICMFNMFMMLPPHSYLKRIRWIYLLYLKFSRSLPLSWDAYELIFKLDSTKSSMIFFMHLNWGLKKKFNIASLDLVQ